MEIGPGRGALTHALLKTGGHRGAATLDVIEIDRDLGAAAARAAARQSPHRRCTKRDALEFDFATLASDAGGRLRVIGNLPYNISTPLLFHLLDSAGVIDDLHVMLQREVVDRIAAAPGSQRLRPAHGDAGAVGARRSPCSTSGPAPSSRRRRSGRPSRASPCAATPAFAVSPHFARGRRRRVLAPAQDDCATRCESVVSPEQIAACGVDLGARPETLAPESFNRMAQRWTERRPRRCRRRHVPEVGSLAGHRSGAPTCRAIAVCCWSSI